MSLARWLTGRRGRERGVALDARSRQNRARAIAVLRQLRDEDQPARYVSSLEPFVDLAPETLALGPAPASLTMRLLFGLCAFEGEQRERFLDLAAVEGASASPTMRAVRRDGLIAFDGDGRVTVTARGRALYEQLARVGAFS